MGALGELDPMISPALSVIICAHNPRPDYLRRALAALESQTLPRAQWELILVDNASSPALAGAFPLAWHPRGRHVREESIGLVNARLCGIAAATGEVIVFVDDDNVLAPDYLERTAEIARDYPFLGAWGGRITGEFESPPPEWMRRYYHLLALRDFSRDQWSNRTDNIEAVPCGAGLCIRTDIARAYAENVKSSPRRASLGRTGGTLSSCEDTDMALLACDRGLGTGIFTRLHLAHLIPTTRLGPEYLVRLAEGMMRSYLLMMSLRHPVEVRRTSRVERWFNVYRRWRMRPEVRQIHDAELRGEMQAYRQLGLQ